MNQEEYMNNIFQTQLAQSTFLICLQQQLSMFQNILPQMHYGYNNYILNPVQTYDEQKISHNIKEQQDLENQLQAQAIQKPICIKNQIKKDTCESQFNGHWTQKEHELYLEFINNHFDILKSKYDKKSKKIFKMMSQYIQSRTATQCRSHHQKFNPLLQIKRRKKQKY